MGTGQFKVCCNTTAGVAVTHRFTHARNLRHICKRHWPKQSHKCSHDNLGVGADTGFSIGLQSLCRSTASSGKSLIPCGGSIGEGEDRTDLVPFESLI